MNDNALTCHGCYWADKCLCDKRCDDFTPIEQLEDTPYYENIFLTVWLRCIFLTV